MESAFLCPGLLLHLEVPRCFAVLGMSTESIVNPCPMEYSPESLTLDLEVSMLPIRSCSPLLNLCLFVIVHLLFLLWGYNRLGIHPLIINRLTAHAVVDFLVVRRHPAKHWFVPRVSGCDCLYVVRVWVGVYWGVLFTCSVNNYWI